jgi:hypothetical protein
MSSPELETLLAKDAIHEALVNYCRGMDRIDDPLSRASWHEGGGAFYEGMGDVPGHAFCDSVLDFHPTLAAHTHELSNIAIRVRGDRAVSESYVQVTFLYPEKDGRHVVRTTHGRYLDRWSRRDGRWALDHRRYLLTFYYTHEVQPKVGAFTTRAADDPSYALFASLEEV